MKKVADRFRLLKSCSQALTLPCGTEGLSLDFGHFQPDCGADLPVRSRPPVGPGQAWRRL